MSVYLSGPMRGIPRFNFPAFYEAEAFLGRLGMDVVNPAKHDIQMYPDIESWPGFETGDIAQCPQFDVRRAIMWDLEQVADCTSIAVLPGWQSSKGANLEVSLARLLDHDILDAVTGFLWYETTTDEAERIVNGARRWNYGTPKVNHGRTAAMWGAYLGVDVSARDVCWMNILQKVSRDRNAPVRDNLVDTIGYARNIELLDG